MRVTVCRAAMSVVAMLVMVMLIVVSGVGAVVVIRRLELRGVRLCQDACSIGSG